MIRRKDIWRDAIRRECSRPNDRRRKLPQEDIPRQERRRRRKLAEQRSIVAHDRAYRDRNAQRGGGKRSLADTCVCDVDAYHNHRLKSCILSPADLTDLTFRWMQFERTYKPSGRWVAPKRDRPPVGIYAHFNPSHSVHSTHRWLVSQCRGDVWLDKGTQHMRSSEGAQYTSTCTCGGQMQTSRFNSVCAECGHTTPRVKERDMNRKELECVQTVSPSYKRNNHLHEWITRVQALERKIVPLAVKQSVLASFEKWGFDRKAPTHNLVRKFLRGAGYQRYFEHVPQIMQWLSGKKQAKFDDVTVRQIKKVFGEIQAPFERNKPAGRKNFLSYSYVLYKVCELLELDDLLHIFPLLKSRANLMKADQVWRGICNECGYQFIPT